MHLRTGPAPPQQQHTGEQGTAPAWAAHYSFHAEIFLFVFLFVCFGFTFVLRGSLQGQRAEVRGQGDKWDWDSTKNQ